MPEHPERKKLIEKMFNAAVKEKFSQFSRKHDPQVVFEVWAEVMGNQGGRSCFSKWEWKAQMTITEALDYLDCCCDSIESLIQERLANEK